MEKGFSVSVVLPAFNEENAIGDVIREVKQAMDSAPYEYEILVVDDASMDATHDRARAEGARVIRRPRQGGSGAAGERGSRPPKVR